MRGCPTMAEIDRLEVVLSAQPHADKYAADMKKAEGATDQFADSTAEASLQSINQLQQLEALSSGVNGLVGGYSKMIAATERLGLVNEEQFKMLQKTQGAMELIAGPIEIIIALKKLSAVASMAHTGALAGETAATGAATTATWSLNAALYANPVGAIVIAIIALIAVLYILERKFGLVTAGVEMLGDAFERVKDGIQWITDNAGNAVDALSPLADVAGAVGGGASRLLGGG